MSAHLLAAGQHSPGDDLLDSLQRWQDAEAAKPEPATPGLRMIDAHRATIEQAKAALMHRYQLDSLPAFAVLIRWSRLTHTPVHILAETLVHGPREADPWTMIRDRRLIRWLEDQLLQTDPLSSPGSHGRRRSGRGPVPTRLGALESCAEERGCHGTVHAAGCPRTTRPGTTAVTAASSPDPEGNQNETQDTTMRRVAHPLRYLARHVLQSPSRPSRTTPNTPPPVPTRPRQR